MTVMANDFVPIQPYQTEIVTLGVGQRSDVIVEANGKDDEAYWMRSVISNCSRTIQPNAQAIIYYPHANKDKKPTTTAWVDNTAQCANVTLLTLTRGSLTLTLRTGCTHRNNPLLPYHPSRQPRYNYNA